MTSKLFFCLLVITCSMGYAQNTKTENVFIFTLDGLRWQDVFNGMDEDLLKNTTYSRNVEEMKNRYEGGLLNPSRSKIMPFLWKTVAEKGVIIGNRKYGNKANIINKYSVSYPGYSEMFCGFADDEEIKSNKAIYNPNPNVLEFIHNIPTYTGKVCAFTSWEKFQYILNDQRSTFDINAGIESMPKKENLNEKEKMLYTMQDQLFNLWSNPIRQDILTYKIAKEYVEKNKPNVVYIGFNDTDEYAHIGFYEGYLASANMLDKLIEEMWNYVQSTPEYKDKTTFIITCDHGRGDKVKSEWTEHSNKIEGADQVWLAAIGPDIKKQGELKKEMQTYQQQLPATIFKLLGLPNGLKKAEKTPFPIWGD